MKTKELHQVTFHYAQTNKYTAKKLIDDDDKEQGIIKLFDSESDIQPIRVKFLPDYVKKFNPNGKIEIDTYCGIVSHISDIKSTGCTLVGVGYGQVGPAARPIDNVITYDSDKGYCFQYPVTDYDPRSQPVVYHSSSGQYTMGYTDAPIISPDSFGYIQGDFKGNLTNALSPLCTIFQKKLAYVEDYQNGKLKIQTSIYDKKGYTMQLSPILINEIIDNVESIKEPKKENQQFINLPILNTKELIEIKNTEFIQKIGQLKRQSVEITKSLFTVEKDYHVFLQELEGIAFSGEHIENVVNLLGTENIINVHNDSI